MASDNWTISGEYIESCNCDYLCPCIYTNPQEGATEDHCYALMAFRIDQGSCGDVDLSGQKMALAIRSGKVMADGGWIFAGVVDEGANEAQRAALAKIVSGEAGGPLGMVRDNLVSDFRGVEVAAIEFVKDGLRQSVNIPGVMSYEIEGVASRNGSGNPYYIDNVGHPANSRLALARSKHTKIEGFGLELDMVGKANNGHFAPFSWSA
jgi:hypothetical protein